LESYPTIQDRRRSVKRAHAVSAMVPGSWSDAYGKQLVRF
jgi:hypothetical protein